MSLTVATPASCSRGPRITALRAPRLAACAHHALHAATAQVPLAAQARRAQALHQREGLLPQRRVGHRQVAVEERPPPRPLARDRQHDALHAGAEADAGRGRPAERLHQPVVAAAAPDRALGAEAVARELEDGHRVVVEAAHERRVLLVRDPQPVQRPEHGRAVCLGGRRQVVEQRRRPAHDLGDARVLGVEQAQRVVAHARAGVLVERVEVVLQVAHQQLAVGPARVGVAHAADAQAQPGHLQAAQDAVEQRDHLGVEQRVVAADGLGAELPVLAVAAALGRLVAEHRREVPELHRQRQLVHAVLHEGADHRRRALGAQRQGAAAAVLEGVHLLPDHVGAGADAAHEDLGLLEGRRHDLAVPVAGEGVAGGVDHPLAHPGLRGQHVARAPRRRRAPPRLAHRLDGRAARRSSHLRIWRR